MRSSRLMAAVVAGALLAACGPPSPGEGCNTRGYLCQDENSALECRDGKWRALPCRGPAGCRVDGRTVQCDVADNLMDDACAESLEGYSICGPSGLSVLECRTGSFQQTLTCSSCAPTTPLITCNP